MDVQPYSLPLSAPLSTAEGSMDRRRGFVVRVAAGDDTGVGEAAPLPGFTESYEACRTALREAAAVAAEEGLPVAHEGIDEAAHPAAAHGVSLAILDAAAHRLDQPLHRLFADRARTSVPVNATIGDADAEGSAAAAAEAVAAGFDCLKVKVGARSVDTDVARLRAIRDRVGDGVTLRADANGAWSRAQASRAADGLAECDLEYLEQPLPAGDLTGHASLRSTGMSIALDESLLEYGLGDVTNADAADAVVCKPMAHGSPAAAHELASRALRAGLTVAVTTTIDAVVARSAAVHVAASLEAVAHCGLATADRLGADLGADPAPVADGEIRVPTGPGLGVGAISP